MTGDGGSKSVGGLRLTPRTIALVALGIVLVLFWALNRNEVEISFILFDATVKVWFALLISALLGFGIGVLFSRRRG